MDPLTFMAAGVEPLTDDEINRLIEYVGVEPKSREELKGELDGWRCFHWMFRGPFPTQTAIRSHARRVENATRRLLALIDPNEKKNPWLYITGCKSAWYFEDFEPSRNFPPRPSLKILHEGLQELLRLSRSLQLPTDPTSMRGQILNTGLSKFDLRISILVRMYEKEFRPKAGASRRADGTPAGPFIRFAEFCLNELHIIGNDRPYEKETIIRGLTNVRARNSSRRPPTK